MSGRRESTMNYDWEVGVCACGSVRERERLRRIQINYAALKIITAFTTQPEIDTINRA